MNAELGRVLLFAAVFGLLFAIVFGLAFAVVRRRQGKRGPGER